MNQSNIEDLNVISGGTPIYAKFLLPGDLALCDVGDYMLALVIEILPRYNGRALDVTWFVCKRTLNRIFRMRYSDTAIVFLISRHM